MRTGESATTRTNTTFCDHTSTTDAVENGQLSDTAEPVTTQNHMLSVHTRQQQPRQVSIASSYTQRSSVSVISTEYDNNNTRHKTLTAAGSGGNASTSDSQVDPTPQSTTMLHVKRRSLSASLHYAQRAIFKRVRLGTASQIMPTSTKTKMEKKESRQIRKERKATHTLAIVIGMSGRVFMGCECMGWGCAGVFLFCWIPFFACHTVNAVYQALNGKREVPEAAFYYTTWVGYMNSFMNPIVSDGD
jgi:hypothetical protein